MYLSVPQVAKRLGVHRNTVLYWLKMGYVRSKVKNRLVSRPQNLISVSDVEKIEKDSVKRAEKEVVI